MTKSARFHVNAPRSEACVSWLLTRRHAFSLPSASPTRPPREQAPFALLFPASRAFLTSPSSSSRRAGPSPQPPLSDTLSSLSRWKRPCRVLVRALSDGDLYLARPPIPLTLSVRVKVFPYSSLCGSLGGGTPLLVFVDENGIFAVEGGNSGRALLSPSSCFDDRWISVLTNSKEEALTMAFRGEQSAGENSLEDLTKAIIEDVQRLPGNDVCCDCGSAGICLQSEAGCQTPSLFLWNPHELVIESPSLLMDTDTHPACIMNLNGRTSDLYPCSLLYLESCRLPSVWSPAKTPPCPGRSS